MHDAFVAHNAMHEPCSHPNCKFSGTKKIVGAHYLSAHGAFSGTGYKDIDVDGQSFRVLLGTSPEEVEQWRAARRMRFPSAANVTAKLQHSGKLSAAGGVEINASASGTSNRNQKRKMAIREKDQLGGSNVKQKRVTSAKEMEAPLVATAAAAEAQSGREGPEGGAVAGSRGPAAIPAAEAKGEGETTEEASEKVAEGEGTVVEAEAGKSHNTDKNKKVCYDFFKGRCTEGQACPFLHTTEVTVCKFFLKGHCRLGRRCKNMHDREAAASVAASKRRDADDNEDTDENRKRKKNGLYLPKPLAGGTRGTLLRKLLQDRIVEEENIILQCLRHFATKPVIS